MADRAVIRLGTRGSMLARMQSQMMADELMRLHPGVRVELVIVKTSGDRIQDRPLHEMGGKGLFTKELEQALLAREVDFAVHSFKDVPVTMPLVDTSDLTFAAIPKREDPRDVLVSNKAKRLVDLPTGARVGSSSLRRRAQVLEKRPDLVINPIRGNVDTRIRKMKEGACDATILALAGLRRSGLFAPNCMNIMEIDEMLPASAQGALALQCRRDNDPVRKLLAVMNDGPTTQCVAIERDLVRRLEGDCHSPIAALARIEQGRFELHAAAAARDGSPPVLRASAQGTVDDAKAVLDKVYRTLEQAGVQALLAGRR